MTGLDSQFSQIAGNHAMRDPRTKAIVDKVLQMMGVNGGIAALDPTMSSILSMAVTAFGNSGFGSALGMQNGGDTFANIHQGILAAGSMPVNLGGAGGMTGMARTGGMSSRSMAVASQLTNAVNSFATNSAGGLNTANTHGLNTGTLSQMAASYMQRRGLTQGDVYEVNMGTSGKEALDAIARAGKEQGVNTQDADVKAMQKIAVVNEVRRNMLMKQVGAKTYEEYKSKTDAMSDTQRIALEQGVDSALLNGAGKDELSNTASKYGVSVGDIKVDDGMLAGARQIDKGALSGTFATKKLTTDLQQTLKATSENVATLGKLFNTQDFQQLQGIADKLRLGSLSDKDNATKVKNSLKDAQALALSQGRTIQDVLTEQGDIVTTLAQVSGGEQNVNRQSVEAIQRRTAVYEANNRRGYDTRTKEEVMQEQAALELNAQNQVGGVAVLEQVFRNNPALKEQFGEQWDAIMKDYNSGDITKMHAASRKAQALAQSIDPNAADEHFKRNAYAKSELNVNENAINAQGRRNAQTQLNKFFGKENDEKTGLLYHLTGAGAGENRMSHDEASGMFQDILGQFGGNVGEAEDFFNSIQKGTEGKDEAGIEEWLNKQREQYKSAGMSDKDIERRIELARKFAKAGSKAKTAIRGVTRTLQQTKGVREMQSVGQKEEFQRAKDEATLTDAMDLSTKAEGGVVDKIMAGLMLDGGLDEGQALFARFTEGWTDTDEKGNKVKKSAYDAASGTYNYKGLAEGGMTRLKVNWDKDGKGTLDTGGLQGKELDDFYEKAQNILGVSSREELNALLKDPTKYKKALANALRRDDIVGKGDQKGGMIFADRATAQESQREYERKGEAFDAVSRAALKGLDVGNVQVGEDGKLTELSIGDKIYKGDEIDIGIAENVRGNDANIQELKKIAGDNSNPGAKRAQKILQEVAWKNTVENNDLFNEKLNDEQLAEKGIGEYDDEGKLVDGSDKIEEANEEARKYLEETKKYDDDLIDKITVDGKLDMKKAYELRNAQGEEGKMARDFLAYRAQYSTFTGDWETDKKNFEIDEAGNVKSKKSGIFTGQNIHDENSAAGKAYAKAYGNQQKSPTSKIEELLHSIQVCVVGNRLRITDD